MIVEMEKKDKDRVMRKGAELGRKEGGRNRG